MNREPPNGSAKTKSPWGIRLQVQVVLNALMAVLVAGFLAYDSWGDRQSRLSAIHTGLNEESRLLWLGSLHLRASDTAASQAFVDDVLAHLSETHGSQHIVIVNDGTRVYLALAEGIPESIVAELTRNIAERGGATFRHGGLAFMVGQHTHEGRTAIIAEDLAAISAAVQADLSRHILSVVFLAVVGAVLINIVVTRIVILPLEQLAAGVVAIEQGALGTQIPCPSSRELAELADVINHMSLTLAKNDEERLQQMAKAKRIQEHLQPKPVAIPGLTIATAFRPADEVAGDFYDVIPLPDTSCLVCVADVSGHGVSAALNAVMLKVVLSAAVERSAFPGDILRSIDATLVSVTLPEMFVTMVVLRVWPRAGVLEYASAGHESCWILRPNGELQELSSTGPPVGTGFGMDWETKTLASEPGMRILLSTDGVTEAAAPDGTLFSRNRLGKCVREGASLSLQELVVTIEQDVDRHCQQQRLKDDVTLLAIEITPTTGAA